MTEQATIVEPEVINVGDFEPKRAPHIVDSSKSKDTDSPNQLIAMAIDKGLGVDGLSKLMDLKKDWEDREARKAFARDMAIVQSKTPRVLRTKENKQTNSWYAPLDEVNSTILPVASEYGFSISFSEGSEFVGEHKIPMKEKMFRTTMILRHRDGHQEIHFYDLPTDEAGFKGGANKTAVHGKASSTTYAERYLLCQVFSITIQGLDNDGNTTSRTLSETEENLIRNRMADCERLGKVISERKMLEYVAEMQKKPVNTIDEIEVQFFARVMHSLDNAYRQALQANGYREGGDQKP